MSVLVQIIDGPIGAEAERSVLARSTAMTDDRTGAIVRFEGIVRRIETDMTEARERALTALDYETYDPMALLQLERLARETATAHGVISIVVLHSRGRVRVGERSFVLVVASPHRKEALAAMHAFIDRLKVEVPIWKRPVWAS